MQTRVLCLDPLVYGPKDMANQKVDHSDITTGGNGPFPQKRTPFFPRPSYRQTIANSLAIAKLSPGSILNVNFCFWNAVATLLFDFGCGCVWRLGWVGAGSTMVGLCSIYIISNLLLWLLYTIIILSMEPRFHALIVCRIFDLFSPRSRY